MKNLKQTKSARGTRIYVDDTGLAYPSVSTVANFFFSTYGLHTWRKKVGLKEANKITNASAKRGTAIHKCIETNTTETKPEYQPFLNSWLKSETKERLRILHSELKLSYLSTEDERVRFAGTADIIGLFDNELIVGDFKVSDKPKDVKYMGAYALQLACYALAYEQTYSPQVIKNGFVFNILADKVVAFKFNLAEAKKFILSTLLTAYWDYYNLPEDERGYASAFIKDEINQFNKQLPNYIEEK
jgi:hypothetical protein